MIKILIIVLFTILSIWPIFIISGKCSQNEEIEELEKYLHK